MNPKIGWRGGGGMLKKDVVLCGEGVGDEKHVRIRKRKKKVMKSIWSWGGGGLVLGF